MWIKPLGCFDFTLKWVYNLSLSNCICCFVSCNYIVAFNCGIILKQIFANFLLCVKKNFTMKNDKLLIICNSKEFYILQSSIYPWDCIFLNSQYWNYSLTNWTAGLLLFYDIFAIEIYFITFPQSKFTLSHSRNWNLLYDILAIEICFMMFSPTYKHMSLLKNTQKEEEREIFEPTTFCLARGDANHYAKRAGWKFYYKSLFFSLSLKVEERKREKPF